MQLFQNQNRGGKSRGRQNGRPASRALGELVLAPGVGRVPSRPYGATNSVGIHCWDALNTAHAGLPRAVGPYAVVRTTRIVESNRRVNVFGTAVDLDGNWSNTVMWSSVAGGTAVNALNNVELFGEAIPGITSGSDSTLTVVPSAITVQVMNANPLQTTTGLVYAAVCPAQLSMVDNFRTWDTFESEFISFMKPRLMSMPKLALRGVQLNSYPLNMSAIANFEGIANHADGVATWVSTGPARDGQFLTGWAPIVVVNTGHATDSLTFAITVEWRVRFDISNPAVASHQHHPITPDKVWDGMVKTAMSLGNGVREIAETVANVGQAVSSLRAIGGRQSMPMLPPIPVD